MLKHHILLMAPVQAYYADEISKRIFFLTDVIVDFTLLQEKGQIYAVNLTTQTPIDSEELARKLNHVVVNDILPQHIVPDKVIWRSEARPRLQEDVYSQMLRSGIVFEAGEGQVGVSEIFMQVMDCFDRIFQRIAITDFAAREYRYPTLIPTTAIAKCGYFTSFPHYLMFVTRLHSDVDNYTEFLEQAKSGREAQEFALNYCNNVDYCLPPTMCFHTYHQYDGRELPDSAGSVVTSRGKSFRFESRYRKTLERLWDFTIREIVFLGPRDFVLNCRSRFMEKAQAVIEQLGLMGHCEVASDPFFCNAEAAEKVWSQKLLELKYEMRLNVTEGQTIAAGSFNFHERFFGENFRIGSEKTGFVHTACVGFGLERFAYAFFCQYGIDSSAWPDAFLEMMS